MQLKTYSDERDMVADFLAYNRVDGDRAAGRRVQAEVDAGTSLREISQLATRYARGDNAPMAEAQRASRPATQQEVFDAGCSLDADARAIMQAQRLTYSQALREAQERAPSAAATYSRAVKLPDADSSELKRRARAFADAGTAQIPITIIANLVTGMPRLPSNEIDWESCVFVVNNFVDEDVRREAAEQFLQGLVDKSTNVTRDEIDAA